MIKIVIGGITDSEEFVEGFGLLHLANKKTSRKCIHEFHDKAKKDYVRWVRFLNASNGWKHEEDFISWFEYIYGGPKSLIGGIKSFGEFIYEEYGIRFRMTQSRIREVSDAFREAKKLKMLNEAKILAQRRVRRVSVVHEGHPGVGLLSREIMSHGHLIDRDGLQLTIFNIFPFMGKSTARLHDDLASLPCHTAGVRTIKIAKDFKNAIQNCDLLIFMGNDAKMTRPATLMETLQQNAVKWTKYGLIVDKYVDNPNMRVILTCMIYPCFNATFFIHAASKIPSDLVVAVTHHLAFYPMVYLSKASGIPLAHIMQRTAYVWGSPNISHFVDLENTDFIFNRTLIPAEKVEEIKELAKEIDWANRTNPFDNAEFEDDFTWRKMDYVVRQLENIWTYVSKEKERITEGQHREPYVATIRATMEIIDHWYCKILLKMPISVGINTSGAYGFPKGIVVSVPALVRDNDRRGWYEFRWCVACRRAWDLDLRARWNPSTCPHKTLHKLTSIDICCHQRNPDIILPDDKILKIEEMAYSIAAVFASLDDSGKILSKLLDPSELGRYSSMSYEGSISDDERVIDDYAARIRRKKYKILMKNRKATLGRVLFLKKKYAVVKTNFTRRTTEGSKKEISLSNKLQKLTRQEESTTAELSEKHIIGPATFDKLLDSIEGTFADTIPLIDHYVRKIGNKKERRHLKTAIHKLKQIGAEYKKSKSTKEIGQTIEVETQDNRKMSDLSIKSGEDDFRNQSSSKNIDRKPSRDMTTLNEEEYDDEMKEIDYESSEVRLEHEGEHEEDQVESEWDLEKEVQNDIFLSKLLDAITDDDIPLVKRYKEQVSGQYIPKDFSKSNGEEPLVSGPHTSFAKRRRRVNNKFGALSQGEWFNDPEIFQNAEGFFSDQSVENPGRTYLKEYMSEKLAKIDWFCDNYVPQKASQMYCAHTNDEHKKFAEENDKQLFSFLPKTPPKIVKMVIDKFLPPERESGESDVAYETRWAEAREIFEKKLYNNYSNRTGEEVYYGNSLAKVVTAEEGKEEYYGERIEGDFTIAPGEME